MWLALKAFLGENLLKLSAYLMMFIGVMVVLFGARDAGKNAEKANTLMKNAKDVRKAHAIEDKNRSMRDGDALIKLRKDWMR